MPKKQKSTAAELAKVTKYRNKMQESRLQTSRDRRALTDPVQETKEGRVACVAEVLVRVDVSPPGIAVLTDADGDK